MYTPFESFRCLPQAVSSRWSKSYFFSLNKHLVVFGFPQSMNSARNCLYGNTSVTPSPLRKTCYFHFAYTGRGRFIDLYTRTRYTFNFIRFPPFVTHFECNRFFAHYYTDKSEKSTKNKHTRCRGRFFHQLPRARTLNRRNTWAV